MTNFRLFQLKEFADDNFKFDKNGKKFSNYVENAVRKEEIVRSPFPTVFLKEVYCRHVKPRACLGEG